ncbi:PREDICTED: putative ALA-interacting subunit 2 isoform X2 [Camelina sativa]|uniref:ALA-interacting subunit n=1 Tax=Camelina sativa TaxID=90675 RepID=A0ABM0X6J7_CAMSA|nr:PREDICTED: putative ALA-interacting subunit 2 isoform X2 [Camelina sativa]
MMEVEGSSTSMNRAPDQSSSLRSKALYQFKQQKLPACKPVLTPTSVITVFLLMGFVFTPIGLITLRASRDAIEIIDRYDVDCIPEEYKTNKLLYITDSSIPKNCTRYLKVQKYMKAPIFIYYQLDNYYQNHRRYVKSRSDQQLLHGLEFSHTSSCEPEESANGLPIVPCGLIAWSMFNDTFAFARERTKLKLSDQEDFIVWMRAAALLSFRKLYGRIEEDLEPGNVVEVNLMNNYNTYSFSGQKKLTLSTSNWLGGRNDFLGITYIVVGSSSIVISIIFMLLHLKNPRPYGDNSWNKKSLSS